MSEWKAGWREFGDQRCFFRSAWESNWGRYLEWLRVRGDIQKWEHEPETFWFEKIRRGTRSYLPDFRVTERNGSVVFHEVKGWMDQKSATKIKRMRIYHPTVKLIVIDKKQYASVRNALGGVIPGWETNSKPTISIERLLPPMTAETMVRPSGSWWSVRRAP